MTGSSLHLCQFYIQRYLSSWVTVCIQSSSISQLEPVSHHCEPPENSKKDTEEKLHKWGSGQETWGPNSRKERPKEGDKIKRGPWSEKGHETIHWLSVTT